MVLLVSVSELLLCVLIFHCYVLSSSSTSENGTLLSDQNKSVRMRNPCFGVLSVLCKPGSLKLVLFVQIVLLFCSDVYYVKLFQKLGVFCVTTMLSARVSVSVLIVKTCTNCSADWQSCVLCEILFQKLCFLYDDKSTMLSARVSDIVQV